MLMIGKTRQDKNGLLLMLNQLNMLSDFDKRHFSTKIHHGCSIIIFCAVVYYFFTIRRGFIFSLP
jgi:hypothetical protein